MTKAEAIKAINGFGTDAAFLGNVILNWHSKPTTKLRGLATLLQQGHDCRTANLSIDTLVIDGRIFGWEILESPILVSRWMSVAQIA